jgi:hypothetical protein
MEGFKKLQPEFNKNKNFIHFPIRNMNIGNNNLIIKLCSNLYKRINNGEKIYIHCTGGHGRTGIISTILLCMLYKISPDNAFEYLQYCHYQRESRYYGNNFYNKSIDETEENSGILIKDLFQRGQVPTPQTSKQRQQVRTIVSIFFNNNFSEIKKLENEIKKLEKKNNSPFSGQIRHPKL